MSNKDWIEFVLYAIVLNIAGAVGAIMGIANGLGWKWLVG